MIDASRALFRRIAEGVVDSIVNGSLPEEGRAPSTSELATACRVNRATAGRGLNTLVGRGVLYKRRGIGMFVAPGARDRLMAERRADFADHFLDPLLAEARKLGLGPDEVTVIIRERGRHDN